MTKMKYLALTLCCMFAMGQTIAAYSLANSDSTATQQQAYQKYEANKQNVDQAQDPEKASNNSVKNNAVKSYTISSINGICLPPDCGV